jgi:hypothetical protein
VDVGIAHAVALVLRLGVPLRDLAFCGHLQAVSAQRLDVEVHDRTATRSRGGGTRLHVAFAVGATIVAAGAIASVVLVNAKATDLFGPHSRLHLSIAPQRLMARGVTFPVVMIVQHHREASDG